MENRRKADNQVKIVKKCSGLTPAFNPRFFGMNCFYSNLIDFFRQQSPKNLQNPAIF